MVALVLILVMLWLQSLADVFEIRKLKRIQRIFDDAFAEAIKDDDLDIEVDRKKGEITLKAKMLFSGGDWTFNPTRENRARFARVRTHIADVLDEIQEGFESSDVGREYEAREHVEVLVVGHTDCRPFRSGVLRTNWDLSTMRATSLASFLTEPCDDPDVWTCCSDGSTDCEPEDLGRRVAPSWRVLPAGRGQHEPRPGPDGAAPSEALSRPCTSSDFPRELLDEQRRVVIQIVPRLDKIILRQ